MATETTLFLTYRRTESGALHLVAIDGRPVELSGADLAALLRLKSEGEWDHVRSVILPEGS